MRVKNRLQESGLMTKGKARAGRAVSSPGAGGDSGKECQNFRVRAVLCRT